MKIEIHQNWFAPSPRLQVDDIRFRSGKRYRPGVHDMPDHLFEFLPSTVTILEPPKDMSADESFKPMKKRDLLKEQADQLPSRALDQYQELHDEAEKNRKEARKAILAKAREVKAKKKAEREATAEASAVATETKEL